MGAKMHFAIMIYDEPGSAALRDQHRQAHLDYLQNFDAQTLFAGPFTTDDEAQDLGSLRLIEFPDRAAADRHIADEPYVIGGVQKRWQIHVWEPKTPHTWRDCPRTEGNIQFLIHALDKPGQETLRAETTAARMEYLTANADRILARGPLLDEDGKTPVGGVLLLDMPGRAAADAFWANDPFNKAGLHETVEFHRWRFGRVFDRFK